MVALEIAKLSSCYCGGGGSSSGDGISVILLATIGKLKITTFANTKKNLRYLEKKVNNS